MKNGSSKKKIEKSHCNFDKVERAGTSKKGKVIKLFSTESFGVLQCIAKTSSLLYHGKKHDSLTGKKFLRLWYLIYHYLQKVIKSVKKICAIVLKNHSLNDLCICVQTKKGVMMLQISISKIALKKTSEIFEVRFLEEHLMMMTLQYFRTSKVIF